MERGTKTPGLPADVRTYIAVLLVLAVTLFALAGWQTVRSPWTMTPFVIGGMIALFIGCFIAQVVPPRLLSPGQRVAIHPDEAFVLMAFVTLPGPLVLGVSMLAILAAQIARRNPAVKVAFNVAVYATSVSLASGAYLGIASLGVAPEHAALVVPLVMSSVNHALLCGLLAKLEGAPVLEVLRRDLVSAVALASLIGTVVGYIGLTLLRVHPLALLLMVPLGYVAYRLTLMGYHHENELRTRRVLNRVSDTLLADVEEDDVAHAALDACREVFAPHRAEVTLHAVDGHPARLWAREGDATGNARTMRVSAPVLSASGKVVGELAMVLPWLPPHHAKLDRDLLTLVARFLGLMLAVTRSVQSVHQSEDRLRTILNGVSAPIVVVNARREVVYQNEVVTEMMRKRGASRLDLGHVLSELDAASAERLASALDDTMPEAPPFFEIETRTEDGEKRHFEVTVSPVQLRGGEHGKIIVGHEVTIRRNLEREAEARRNTAARSERLASLGILVAGVAHEINNPLMYMVGNLDLTLMDLEMLEADLVEHGIEVDAVGISEMKRRIHTVKEGSERIGRISKALKVVSRNDASTTHRLVSVTDVLVSVRDLVNLGVPAGVDLTFEVPDEPVIVEGNASELHQVFLNLVQNAMEALSETGGRVSVTCSTRGGNAFIVVTDDGPGIPPDVQARLFTPFYTTKAEGTGLGLSLAHTFIKDHDGELSLDSEVGHGTRFTVRVPVAVEASVVNEADEPPRRRTGGLRLSSSRPTRPR